MDLKAIPLIRGLAFTRTPYHVGSVLENRLGAQIFRTLGKHVVWRLRSVPVSDEINESITALERDGVLALPDFLTAEQFASVRQEFERTNLEFRPLRETVEGRVEAAYHDVDESCLATWSYIGRNKLIHSLAAAVIRRPITTPPKPAYHVYRLRDPVGEDNDVENILHADLHTPTVKAFFFLTDVDETNGAFVYAKGTHKLTLQRLAYEYDMAVRVSRLEQKKGSIPAHLLAKRGPLTRNIMSMEARQKLMVQETPMCVRANTLVVTNNMGFHRRGAFTSAEPRAMVYLNYRHLNHPFR